MNQAVNSGRRTALDPVSWTSSEGTSKPKRLDENRLHVCCGIEIEKRGLSSADSIRRPECCSMPCSTSTGRRSPKANRKPRRCGSRRPREEQELAEYFLDRRRRSRALAVGRARQRQPGGNPAMGSRRGRRGRLRGDTVSVRGQVEPNRPRRRSKPGAEVKLQDGFGKTALHYRLRKCSDPK